MSFIVEIGVYGLAVFVHDQIEKAMHVVLPSTADDGMPHESWLWYPAAALDAKQRQTTAWQHCSIAHGALRSRETWSVSDELEIPMNILRLPHTMKAHPLRGKNSRRTVDARITLTAGEFSNTPVRGDCWSIDGGRPQELTYGGIWTFRVHEEPLTWEIDGLDGNSPPDIPPLYPDANGFLRIMVVHAVRSEQPRPHHRPVDPPPGAEPLHLDHYGKVVKGYKHRRIRACGPLPCEEREIPKDHTGSRRHEHELPLVDQTAPSPQTRSLVGSLWDKASASSYSCMIASANTIQ